MKKEIKVAGGILMKNGKILLARRGYGKMAGKWEFPGGKLEPGETPQECLKRELHEEMGITATTGSVLMDYTHDYGEILIHMYFVNVESYEGEIQLRDHDAVEWVLPSGMTKYDLLPGDVRFAEFAAAGGLKAGDSD